MEFRKILLVAFLLAAMPAAYATEATEDLLDFTYGLGASISVENGHLNESPHTILVRIEVQNPTDEGFPIYIIRQGKGGGWAELRLLGTIPPGERGLFELEVLAEYGRESVQKTRFAIVGAGADGERYGKFFELTEDWSEYERKINESVSAGLLIAVPVIGLALGFLMLFLARTAYDKKGETKESEYSMQTLVLPKTEGRPFSEKLADVIIHPGIVAIEVFWVAIFVMLMADSLGERLGFETAVRVVLLSGMCAFTVPFAYLVASWYYCRREEGKPLRFFIGMFAWGMFVAFFSLLVSSTIASQISGIEGLSFAILVTVLISPFVEELLKGFGVLVLSGHHDYNDTLTGMLLGFSCGAGFAFVENWFYFGSKANPFEMGIFTWIALVFYRSFFNTLAHGCFTASISALIGYVKSNPKIAAYAPLAFLPGLIAAIALHMVFNISAVADGFMVESRQVLFFVFNPMLIILLAALFFLVLVLAILDERGRKLRLGQGSSTNEQLRQNRGRQDGGVSI